ARARPVLVDLLIAVVVDAVAQLVGGAGVVVADRAVLVAVADVDAFIATVGVVAVAGLTEVDEGLVDRAVAVVVLAIAALDLRRYDLDADRGSAGLVALVDVVDALVGVVRVAVAEAVEQREVLIGEAVAVVVQVIAQLDLAGALLEADGRVVVER